MLIAVEVDAPLFPSPPPIKDCIKSPEVKTKHYHDYVSIG